MAAAMAWVGRDHDGMLHGRLAPLNEESAAKLYLTAVLLTENQDWAARDVRPLPDKPGRGEQGSSRGGAGSWPSSRSDQRIGPGRRPTVLACGRAGEQTRRRRRTRSRPGAGLSADPNAIATSVIPPPRPVPGDVLQRQRDEQQRKVEKDLAAEQRRVMEQRVQKQIVRPSGAPPAERPGDRGRGIQGFRRLRPLEDDPEPDKNLVGIPRRFCHRGFRRAEGRPAEFEHPVHR
jgi:hypothetical protein